MTLDLSQLGQALYGVKRWHLQMAKDMGISRMSLHRLLTGSSTLTPNLRSRIDAVKQQRRQAVLAATEAPA